jgi:hypothetical protein
MRTEEGRMGGRENGREKGREGAERGSGEREGEREGGRRPKRINLQYRGVFLFPLSEKVVVCVPYQYRVS